MKRRYITIAFVLAAALVVCWWLWPSQRPNSPSSTGANSSLSPQEPDASASNVYGSDQSRPSMLDPSRMDERRLSAIDAMRKAFSTQIVFFGKVTDEMGNPLPGAKVQYSVADSPLKDGSRYEGISDANGSFSLSGVRGADMTVAVTKEGYYFVRDESSGYFAYGVPNTKELKRPIPTKDNPAIFVLRKMGEAVPLIVTSARVQMPKTGSPVSVNLQTGRTTPGNQGDLVLECWTQNDGMDPNLAQPYNWRFRLTVPGGGLVERVGEFAFEAPEDGYRPVIEFAMPKDAKGWKQDFRNEYFVRLSDGRYARIQLRITTGGAHFATVASYLNPTPRSRNLEHDPAKQIQ